MADVQAAAMAAHFERVPYELVEKVLGHLDAEDLLSKRLVRRVVHTNTDCGDLGLAQTSTRLYEHVLAHGIGRLCISPYCPTRIVSGRKTLWQALSSSERGRRLRDTVTDLDARGLIQLSKPSYIREPTDNFKTVPLFHCYMIRLRRLRLREMELFSGWEAILVNAADSLQNLTLKRLCFSPAYLVPNKLQPLTALRSVSLTRDHRSQYSDIDTALGSLILAASKCEALSLEGYEEASRISLLKAGAKHLTFLNLEATSVNFAKIASKLECLIVRYGRVPISKLPASLEYISITCLEHLVGWESLLLSHERLNKLCELQLVTWHSEGWDLDELEENLDIVTRFAGRGISVLDSNGEVVTVKSLTRRINRRLRKMLRSQQN